MINIQAKEAEIEESENFIPCCFRSLRDRNGPTLKVTYVDYFDTFHFYESYFQESTISVQHLRFIMQSLPREVHMTRRGS